MFFFKPSVLNVDCFTSRQYVHDLYPIDYAHKFFPDWWKALPKSYNTTESLGPIATMKTCTGFNSFFNHGFMIPLWSDLMIGLNGNGTFGWQYSDGVSSAGRHDPVQMNGYLDQQRYTHLKIHTPWMIRCKEDINWSWIPNTWAFQNPSQVVIPPAVVNYKYNYNTDVNTFLNFENTDGKILIKNGTPMVNVIPHTERKLKIHVHKVSNEEFFNLKETGISTSFLNKYNAQKTIMDRLEKEKKCPFGFGR